MNRLLASTAFAVGAIVAIVAPAIASAQTPPEAPATGVQAPSKPPATGTQTPSKPPATGAHTLTRPPHLVHFVEAPYPESEKAAGKAASVVLQIAIGPTGTVDQVAVTQSAGAPFDEAAAQAARQFVFDPAEIDGKASAIRILYRYDFVLRVAAPTTAIFTGQVRDRHTKQPLAEVGVSIEGGPSVTTDADGRFRFDAVTPGGHVIVLGGKRLTELQTTETFEAGKQLSATYDVEPQDASKPAGDEDDLEVVVTPPPVEKQVVSTVVTAEEGRRIPGTQGDVLKVVENMPGVARAALGSANIVVWGAAPQDTRVYMDGVPLPALYHEGGFRSVVHSDMVDSVELLPGGWGAEYGRGIGGLVAIRLKALDQDGFHGSVSSDVIDSSVDVRDRLSDHVRVEIAGRKSYLDQVLPVFTSSNIGEYIPIPRYYDGQARIVWDLGPRESLELGGLLSADAVDDTVPSANPALFQQQSHDTSFQRIWMRWKKHTEDGADLNVVPSFGRDSDSLVDTFGAIPTNLDVTSTVASLRATWQKQLSGALSLTAGIDGQLTRSHFSRRGSNSTPPRTGDEFVFGEAPTNELDSDDATVIAASAAPFATADIALADGRVHIDPGLRFEPSLLAVNHTSPQLPNVPPTGLFQEFTEVEPRLSVRWSPVPALTWKIGWGLYHEPPAPADLSPVFGNPTLPPESAQQLLGGVAAGSPDVVYFEATAFRVTSEDLAVRSSLPSPLTAQALLATGVGRSRGIQFLLRKQIGKRFFGWITYTLSKSERANAPGAPYYPYDFDQTNVLGAVASYDLGGGVEIGGRFRYATGYPRTPVVDASFDVQTGTFEPMFGQLNSIRIPAFWQLDVRISKRFAIGPRAAGSPGSALEVYLDLQNVTARGNPEEIVYSPDYSQRNYITGLPILPVLGARLSW